MSDAKGQWMWMWMQTVLTWTVFKINTHNFPRVALQAGIRLPAYFLSYFRPASFLFLTAMQIWLSSTAACACASSASASASAAETDAFVRRSSVIISIFLPDFKFRFTEFLLKAARSSRLSLVRNTVIIVRVYLLSRRLLKKVTSQKIGAFSRYALMRCTQ